jgi:hypothetical protein
MLVQANTINGIDRVDLTGIYMHLNNPLIDPVSEVVSADAIASQEALSLPSMSVQLSTDHLPLHVNARGIALAIIATATLVFSLQRAQKFLIPLTFGIFSAYTLHPLVVWLERIHNARVYGAILVTSLIFF